MAYRVLGLTNQPIGSVDSPDDPCLDDFFRAITERYPGSLRNEFLEVADGDGNPTGNLKLRGLIHAEGDWHRTFHLHIYSQIGGDLFMMLQRRHWQKDVGADTLDTAVAGHYGPSEHRYGLAVAREAYEELGIEVFPLKLKNVGKRKIRDFFTKGVKNFEIQDIFFCEEVIDVLKCSLKKDEVAGVYKVNLNRLISLLTNRIPVIDGVEAVLLNTAGEHVHQQVSITRDNLRPSEDHYHLKVALMIYWLVKYPEVFGSLHHNPFEIVKDQFPLPREFE